MYERPVLKLVNGAATDDNPRVKAVKIRKRRPSAASLLNCHRCGGNTMIEVKVGMIMKNGKAGGGTKQVLCAGCFMKGERVVLA